MITLFILLILFIGAYSGYKNGVILQLLKTIGYVVVLIFSYDYYRPLSEYLYLMIPYPTPFLPESNPYYFYDERFILTLSMSYYYLISFLLIFFIGWLIVRFLTKLLSYTIEQFKAPEPLSGISGAVLGFIVNYVGIFYLLLLFSLIPYDFVQGRLTDSFTAKTILTSTPKLTESNYQRFIIGAYEDVEENHSTMKIEPSIEENSEEGNEE